MRFEVLLRLGRGAAQPLAAAGTWRPSTAVCSPWVILPGPSQLTECAALALGSQLPFRAFPSLPRPVFWRQAISVTVALR